MAKTKETEASARPLGEQREWPGMKEGGERRGGVEESGIRPMGALR